MNSVRSSLLELCEDGRIEELLTDYLKLCTASEDDSCLEDNESAPHSKKVKRSGKAAASFPNVAGFCRFLGVGTGELEELAEERPDKHGIILAVLEDEALNSGLSATLISAYLKKRLGYDSSSKQQSGKSQLQIRFEHDVLGDGE